MKTPAFKDTYDYHSDYNEGFRKENKKFLDLLCKHIKSNESYDILTDDDKNVLRESYCQSLNYYDWGKLLEETTCAGGLMASVFDSVKSLKTRQSLAQCKSIYELGHHFFDEVIARIDDKISFLFDDKILDMHNRNLDEDIKALREGVCFGPGEGYGGACEVI